MFKSIVYTILVLVLLPVVSFCEEKNEQDLTKNNVNVDGKILMGENYARDANISIIYGGSAFTYQLNSGSKELPEFSNLSNSERRRNYTEFTGEVNINEYWKIIPEFQSLSSSHGMFDHEDFTEESRSFFEGRIKSEYKPAPARWSFDLYFSGNENRLLSKSVENGAEKFSRSGGTVAMDYIWSASNKVGMKVAGEYLDYDKNSDCDNDYFVSSDFIGVFRITEFLMLTISPRFLFNRDKTDYLYFSGGFSTMGMKNLSFELNYEYNNRQYDPVRFLEQNRYVDMKYDINPEIVHRAEAKCIFQLTGLGEGDRKVESLGVTLHSSYENNDNFYNYNLTGNNLLYIEEIPLDSLSSGIDFVTKVEIIGHILGIELSYNQFQCLKIGKSKNITFRPNTFFKSELSYENSFLSLFWESVFSGKVYERSDSDYQKDSFWDGTLSIFAKVSQGMQLYGKIVNLYDQVILYRDGFPEPRRRFLGGIRIVI